MCSNELCAPIQHTCRGCIERPSNRCCPVAAAAAPSSAPAPPPPPPPPAATTICACGSVTVPSGSESLSSSAGHAGTWSAPERSAAKPRASTTACSSIASTCPRHRIRHSPSWLEVAVAALSSKTSVRHPAAVALTRARAMREPVSLTHLQGQKKRRGRPPSAVWLWGAQGRRGRDRARSGEIGRDRAHDGQHEEAWRRRERQLEDRRERGVRL